MTNTLRTADFLAAILPTTGVYFSAKLDGAYWTHEAFQDTTSLALELKDISDNGLDAYYACASYKAAKYINAKGKTKTRTQENVRYVKSLWMDIDVKPEGNHYADQKLACEAVKQMCVSVGIPQPNVWVSSGYGVHIYWTLDRDLTPQEWAPLAELLQRVQMHHGILADHALTTDAARTLRPINTLNYKYDKTAPVRGFIQGDHLSSDALLEQLQAYCDANGILPKQRKTKEEIVLSGDLADLANGMGEYPPSDAEKMADACAVFAAMRDTQGANQDNVEWFTALTVLNKCTNGHEIAHNWSSGYDGYDFSETQAQLDRIADEYKPASCDTFRKCSTHCQTCTLTVSNPIILGYPTNDNSEEIYTPDEDNQEDEDLPPLPPVFDDKFAITKRGGLLAHITKKAKNGKDEERVWVHCCAQYPIVDFIWLDDIAGEYNARIRSRVRPNVWTVADIKLATIGQGGAALARDLGGKAGVMAIGPIYNLENYMKTWVDDIQRQTATQQVANHLGWQPDGSFLIGSKKYHPDGSVSPTALAKNLAKQSTSNTPRGNLKDFSEALNALYNRPHYMPYQFAILASLGSVLLPLVWNGNAGIPLSLWSSKPGLGKTNAAKVGLAMWGDPNAPGQLTNAEGTTELALYTMAGERKNLPILLDETTPWTGDRLSKFAYRYADGVPKQQAKAEGGLRDNSHLSWCNVCYMTSNTSVLSQIMAVYKNNEAQSVRVFEYEIPNLAEMFGPKWGIRVEDQHLLDTIFANSGTAGEAFAKTIALKTRQDVLRVTMRDMVQDIYKRTGVGAKGRYWVHFVAATITAGTIAKRIGIHDFPMGVIWEWALGTIVSMTDATTEAQDSPEDLLADMLRDLYPGLIITLTEGRHNTGAILAPNVSLPRTVITGRVIQDQDVIYLSTAAVLNWCSRTGANFRELSKNLTDLGILGNKSARFMLGVGTPINVTRSRCWALNKVSQLGVIPTPLPNNVIQGDFSGKQDTTNDDTTVPSGQVRVDAGQAGVV